MKELKIFQFDGVAVRTIIVEGEPYFVGKDIALAIGYKNYRDALDKHVKTKYKRLSRITTPSGIQEMIVVAEPGLYQIAGESKLASAEPFQDWVYEEVLPAIRKHGMYATDELIANPDLLIAVATELKEERAEKEAAQLQLKEQEHQVVFAKSVEVSRNSVAVKVLATILKQNGVNIGQNRMFQWLRDNGYLSSRTGKSWNMPTQRSMDMGLFELKPNTYFHNDGVPETTYTPLVTGKGQVYFINKFKQEMILK